MYWPHRGCTSHTATSYRRPCRITSASPPNCISHADDGLRHGGATAVGRVRVVGAVARAMAAGGTRSEEHTSELQSLMRISYAVFCLKKKTTKKDTYIIYIL